MDGTFTVTMMHDDQEEKDSSECRKSQRLVDGVECGQVGGMIAACLMATEFDAVRVLAIAILEAFQMDPDAFGGADADLERTLFNAAQAYTLSFRKKAPASAGAT